MGKPPVRAEQPPSPMITERPSLRFDPTEIDGTPHRVERQVRQLLTSQPGLSISNLVVRRVQNGVCLTGVIETMPGDADVCGLAKQVSGVTAVINRLLVRSCGEG